ncbi:MAG: glycosyltransferase family 2 protein [Anaerolineales bacterium]|nr:glycosyltransferase family 2 protein [Anaerolineales bacterium]
MDLGIVIVNWNVRELLAACLDSVYADLAGSGLSARVCVVDNGSSDGSAEMVRTQFPRTLLIESENRGMGAGNNLGLKALGVIADRRPSSTIRNPNSEIQNQNSPFAVLILNPDTVVRPGALRQLVDFLRATPQAGVAAPKLLYADGRLQHSGFRFPGIVQAFFDLFPPPGRLAWLLDSPLNGRYLAARYAAGSPFRVAHTLGAAFAVRTEALAGEPLFDETFFMYCEEIDAQQRLRQRGWECWVVPGAEVIHYGGRSTAQDAGPAFVHLWTSRRRLYRRYHGLLVNAVVGSLVQLAMRRRIRANHRASQAGALSPDERAAANRRLVEVMEVWRNGRGRRGRR